MSHVGKEETVACYVWGLPPPGIFQRAASLILRRGMANDGRIKRAIQSSMEPRRYTNRIRSRCLLQPSYVSNQGEALHARTQHIVAHIEHENVSREAAATQSTVPSISL